jgi:DNA repair exonuclease SbcCD nuclease subunit
MKTVKSPFKHNKICCVSDIHIGVHQNGSMWHDIVLEWAKWLHDELINKGIEDIIIAGDLFHYRDEIAVNTIQIATEVMKIWKPFNIGILIGNHDSYYKDKVDVHSLSILSGWNNITIFDKVTTIEHKNKRLTFCPWGTELYEIPDDSDIVFGHFEIETFKLNEFKTCIEGIKSKSLLQKCDLIITGHFHLREERQYKNGTILYLGNPFQMDFGDINSTKGYYILDTKSKVYEFTKNDISPKHIKLKLSDLAREGTLTQSVKDSITDNILRFIIDRTITPDEVDIVLKKFSSLKPLSMNVDYAINFDRFGLDDDLEYDLSGVDIPTAIREFISILEIEDKENITNFTMDLHRRSK